MNLKRLKAALSELQACVSEMEGGGEEEVEAMDEDEAEKDGSSSDSTALQTFKAKMMKYR